MEKYISLGLKAFGILSLFFGIYLLSQEALIYNFIAIWFIMMLFIILLAFIDCVLLP